MPNYRHPEKEGQTVLVVCDRADYGIMGVKKTPEIGSFKLILPVSLQVFYHLVRQGSEVSIILRAKLSHFCRRDKI